jgi:hypothetical protein
MILGLTFISNILGLTSDDCDHDELFPIAAGTHQKVDAAKANN